MLVLVATNRTNARDECNECVAAVADGEPNSRKRMTSTSRLDIKTNLRNCIPPDGAVHYKCRTVGIFRRANIGDQGR